MKSATASGATVTFKQRQDVLTHKDGTNFTIRVHGKLYYLQTVEDNDNIGYTTVANVVDGMIIKGRTDKPDHKCEVCIQGKFRQTQNRNPDKRATAPLQRIHTNLAGPIANESIDGYKYVQSFTDDYSNAVFVYFLKAKNDALQATETFLADVAPYGKVKCIRSDNGTEFTCRDFQTLLRKNGIKHETSAPYSERHC